MVVVTGASGHVGATLVRDLLARGRAVRALVHGDAPTPALAGLDVEIARGDVRDPASLRAAFRGADVVFHLAGMISIVGDPAGLVRAVNVDGARNAAEAALACGVRRFVHTSSIHAFDHAPYDAPLDESRGYVTAAHPAYDRSKAAGEAAVRAVIARGLDAVVVNPTGIMGPLDFEPSHTGAALLQYARGRVPVAPDGGFDWVDVRDVARGLLAAAEHGRTGEGYILAGSWRSAMDLGRLAEAILGVPAPRFTVPLALVRAIAPAAVLGSRLLGRRALFTPDTVHALRSNRQVRAEKAARELGHHARPIEETLRDTFTWFMEVGVLRPTRLVAAAPGGAA